MAIWVAVGGRATLGGAALGAFVVNGAKSWFTASAPDLWLYVLGALFVFITLFLPGGLASALDNPHVAKLKSRFSRARTATPAE
jgi:urea transport system permease protein